MKNTSDEYVAERVKQYRWYHRIKVTDAIYTVSGENPHGGYPDIWDLILRGMDEIDFRGKRVLDVGCRDGLFSLEAERRGAIEVIGVDNDLSKGAVEFLLPFLKSKVKMHELNLYDLTPQRFGAFDVILFPGVLYHLRCPFNGLKILVDCLVDGGLILIETAMLIEPSLQNHELMYCPVENSPYELSSCTFFNEKALVTTMTSFHCRFLHDEGLNPDGGLSKTSALDPTLRVGRQLFIFEKDSSMRQSDWLDAYWHGSHRVHDTQARRDEPVDCPETDS